MDINDEPDFEKPDFQEEVYKAVEKAVHKQRDEQERQLEMTFNTFRDQAFNVVSRQTEMAMDYRHLLDYFREWEDGRYASYAPQLLSYLIETGQMNAMVYIPGVEVTAVSPI